MIVPDMTIIDNYRRIRNAIDEKAIKAGREPDDIKIISVSKTFPYTDIQEAIDSGITLFGENKVQEAKEKLPHLHGECRFHSWDICRVTRQKMPSDFLKQYIQLTKLKQR
jgi:uncharacterized pyridoxal phosphate-containing UPF0001 family protein